MEKIRGEQLTEEDKMNQDEREDGIEDTGTEKTTENIRRDKTSRDQK